MPLPRYPRAKPCAGCRSAPAGDRPGSCALLRRGACLPRSGGANGRASIRPRRGGRKGFLLPCLRVRSPRSRHCPACAEAIELSACAADKMVSVVGPLSTTRVSGSHAVERMPIWATSRPATSSMLVSPALRGAGPPNNASIACCWASPGERPAVPATGGARLKSGGTISGALRATANSSGVRDLLFNEAQPLVETAATITRAESTLRMFDSLLGTILTSEERAEQQDHYRNANRCVADIEDQKRTEVPEVQIGEVDDITMPHPVEDIAERPA